MNGDPYYGYRPDNPSNQKTYKSKPTYLQIQVNPPSHQKHNPQYQQNHSPHYNQPQQHQHQQYYLQQQPSRHRSSWSQPPVTPTTPTPPWASQQSAPKRVTKLSQLGGAGQSYGTTYATLPRSSSVLDRTSCLAPLASPFNSQLAVLVAIEMLRTIVLRLTNNNITSSGIARLLGIKRRHSNKYLMSNIEKRVILPRIHIFTDSCLSLNALQMSMLQSVFFLNALALSSLSSSKYQKPVGLEWKTFCIN